MYAGNPNKRRTLVRVLPGTGTSQAELDARRKHIMELQAYQFGVMDDPRSIAFYKKEAERTRRFERSGGMRRVQNADTATLEAEGLGVAPLAIATAASQSGLLNIKFTKSDRYLSPGQTTKDASKGPLMGTLQSFLTRVANGDVAVLNEWNDARKRVVGWQNAWQHELPKFPLTAAQYARVKQLDPSLPVTQIPVVAGPGQTPSPIPVPPTSSAPSPVPAPAPTPAGPSKPSWLDELLKPTQPTLAPAPTTTIVTVPGSQPVSQAAPTPSGGFDLKALAIPAAIVGGILLLSRR